MIPKRHQDILKDKMDIWKSPYGYSCADKRFEIGLVYVADGLTEGEFVHEAAHILEHCLGVFQDKRYLKILDHSMRDKNGDVYIVKDDSFAFTIYRAESPKLVSLYQGNWYRSRPIFSSNGMVEPYAFSDFFAEGYRAYIFEPELLKQKNKELYDYIEWLAGDD